jgi:hypothetical protein
LSDDDEPCNPGGNETLLYNNLDNLEIENIKIAPAEYQIPQSLLLDNHAEELSFPKIYCGQERILKFKINSARIAKSELRRHDQRCAQNTSKILYSFKKIQIENMSKSINFVLRKNKLNEKITVENAMDRNYLNNLLNHNEGYNIFKNIRCSPAYWQNKRKKFWQ